MKTFIFLVKIYKMQKVCAAWCYFLDAIIKI